MEAEASLFESSEMLATFLASTPLLTESWKLCNHSNMAAHHSFVVEEIGGVNYVAFSGIQSLDAMWASLVPLGEAAKGIFLALEKEVMQGEEWKEPIMVHGGFLHLFMSIYNTPLFQNQMVEIVNKGKPVVFTGHSLGGPIASLSSLWLLSHARSLSHMKSTIDARPDSASDRLSRLLHNNPLLCITFGSPLLGNNSLSQAILQEGWGGNFSHIVSKHDIFPRLLFAPLHHHLLPLLESCHFTMTSNSPYFSLQQQEFELFNCVLDCVEKGSCLFVPFGNFVFCSNGGAVCVDGEKAVVKLLHLMFEMGSPRSSFEDHLKYGEYVGNMSLQFLKRRDFMEEELFDDSSYEAGLALALQSSEITTHEQTNEPAKECLKMAKRMGRRSPNLNSAGLAIGLSKITPLRAQIELYKAICDESDAQMGYYDAFKMRDASKRDFKVTMNRIKLGEFWDQVIEMMKTNQLPRDFIKRAKWVNASQFYKLLVEPLDIAEYYRRGKHREKGHYRMYGRERRYEIFDKWWREREIVSEELNTKRSKFASLTQDSCFWARVEEAKEWLENVRSENDSSKLCSLWDKINEFDQYARILIEKKEVSKDVVAKNSTYSLWVEELKQQKSQLQHFSPPLLSFLN